MNHVEVARLRGTPRERGRQHGRKLGPQIRRRLRAVLKAARIRPESGGRDALHQRLNDLSVRIERAAPQAHAEITGIADGAGIDVLDAVLLSAFETTAETSGRPRFVPSGCTAVAGRTAYAPVIGQNWDAPTGAHDHQPLVVLDIDDPQLGRQVILASAGGLGWLGMSQWVAVVNNDLVLRTDRPHTGLPSQVIRRELLRCRNITDCIDRLNAVRHPEGRSYLIADRAGGMLSAEVSAVSGAHVTVHDRSAWHTNHVTTSQLAAEEDQRRLDGTYPSSFARGTRAARLITDHPDAEGVRACLRNHDGHPNSICKHDSAEEPTGTAASAIFDLAEATAWIAAGPPCTSTYQAISTVITQPGSADR
jgi:isopenicillin-N N-acyltransferase like protein